MVDQLNLICKSWYISRNWKLYFGEHPKPCLCLVTSFFRATHLIITFGNPVLFLSRNYNWITCRVLTSWLILWTKKFSSQLISHMNLIQFKIKYVEQRPYEIKTEIVPSLHVDVYILLWTYIVFTGEFNRNIWVVVSPVKPPDSAPRSQFTKK